MGAHKEEILPRKKKYKRRTIKKKHIKFYLFITVECFLIAFALTFILEAGGVLLNRFNSIPWEKLDAASMEKLKKAYGVKVEDADLNQLIETYKGRTDSKYLETLKNNYKGRVNTDDVAKLRKAYEDLEKRKGAR
jgi:hypothetical protein